MRKILLVLPLLGALLGLLPAPAQAQELLAEVRVTAENVTVADPTLITQMQNDMQSFLNTRAWTNITYKPEERIKLKVFVGITAIPTNGTYQATMRLISTRPVYGTGYETNVVSFADRSFNFNYAPQQPLDFSPNSFVSNLSSILGYYAYLIIAIDRDTFGNLGGTPYYDQARIILTYSAGQSVTNESDESWRDSAPRNRYWLLNNLTDPQLQAFRTGLYGYYRLGMDSFIEKPTESRAAVMTALTGIQQAAVLRPGTLFARAFFDAKSDEIANIFRTSQDQSQKQQLVTMMVEVDPTNSAKYQTVLNR